jgi:hypothetical protein
MPKSQPVAVLGEQVGAHCFLHGRDQPDRAAFEQLGQQPRRKAVGQNGSHLHYPARIRRQAAQAFLHGGGEPPWQLLSPDAGTPARDADPVLFLQPLNQLHHQKRVAVCLARQTQQRRIRFCAQDVGNDFSNRGRPDGAQPQHPGTVTFEVIDRRGDLRSPGAGAGGEHP